MREILGQERAIGVLDAAVASERVHHAYIFHGPAGVGKFATAQAFARLLLCHQPQHDLTGRTEACGQCRSCGLMASGTHPDYQVVTKELARQSRDPDIRKRKQTNIPSEVLREFLVERAHMTATAGSRKVLIVDEAELMDRTRGGQNILLKTLEEPPDGTFIILVTSNEHRLIVTIRSRCQRVAFAPLSEQIIIQRLAERERERSLQLTEPQRKWLLRFAAGSLGQLDLALQFDLWSWARQIIAGMEAMERGRPPGELGQQMAQMVDGFATAWVEHHGAQASKEAANKLAAGLLWTMLGQLAQQRMTSAAAEQAGRPAWEAEQALAPWLSFVAALRQAEREFAANVNASLVVDHLVSLMHRALAPLAPMSR